ncbi:MAG TPA: tyrosine-type recombinase/integrase, partial [Isosphaeraceae bacterium]|nr:tyrosine-type recombinase/integrase [Isosphaeraceae bacterium]
SDPIGKRNRALVHLLYTAGLRRTECISLDRSDLDLDGRRVHVLGKGRFQKEWLPFGASAVKALNEWLAVHPDPQPDAPLFVRLDRAAEASPQRLTADGLHHVLSTLGRRAGLKRSLWPHAIRHASISRLAEATGGDMPRIQKFSRHSRIETVAKYVDAQREAARDLADVLGSDLPG